MISGKAYSSLFIGLAFDSQVSAATSREQHQPRPRIESLTDLIFGLALSIGSLGLLGNKPKTIEELVLNVSLFLFSFIILISIWLRYTETMSVLPVETAGSRNLNILLLFFVALEPYFFNLIGSNALPLTLATQAYAFDIGAIYVILASFNGILSSEKRHLIEPALIRKYKAVRNIQLIVVAVFWISIIPQLDTSGFTVGGQAIPARFFFWMITLVLSRGTWVLRKLGRI